MADKADLLKMAIPLTLAIYLTELFMFGDAIFQGTDNLVDFILNLGQFITLTGIPDFEPWVGFVLFCFVGVVWIMIFREVGP